MESMRMHSENKSFRLSCDGSTATITLLSANHWGRAWLTDLQNLIHFLAQQPQLEALIFKGTSGVWNPEYPLHETLEFSHESEALAYASFGQQVLQTLNNLTKQIPVIAAVEGPCSLAGLELAMACSHRVMVASPQSGVAGLDRASGIVPAWGLISRVARKLSRRNWEIWSTAETILPREALRLGLLDRVCASGRLEIEVRSFCDELISQRKRPTEEGRSPFWSDWFGRLVHWEGSHRTIEREASIPRIEEFQHIYLLAQRDLRLALVREKQLFAQQAPTSEYRNALRIQHQQREIPRVYPEPMNPLPPIPKKMGIVGGGEIGSSLALHWAERGCEVIIHEATPSTAENAQRRLEKGIQNRIAQKRCTPLEGERIRKKLTVTSQWTGFENVDFAVESAEEDVGVKKNLLAKLESLLRPRVLIATTSTHVLIESLQNEMNRPSRFAGFHLIAPQSALVELVRGSQTDSGTIAALAWWGHHWGFQVAQVGDRVGRLAWRVRMAYLSEGVHLVAEGLDPAAVDQQARRFGFRRGPLEWCDELGFDRLALQAEQFQLASGDYSFARNLLFERFLPFGFLGKQNGEGFYRYRGDRKRYNEIARMLAWNDLDEGCKPCYIHRVDQSNAEGFQRLLLRVINEAASGLSEEPEASPLTIDAVLVKSLGFPSAQGGPLRFADDLGILGIVDRLASYAERYGSRLSPCDELLRRAEASEGFYAPISSSQEILKRSQAA
jgi:3-hydroxyacyl-CoA dehydrogenase/enoyl-CoA hydratase/carnithine racemase